VPTYLIPHLNREPACAYILISQALFSCCRISEKKKTQLKTDREMCTAAEDHCPSCCTNHGEVYSVLCPVVYQMRPGQQGFISIQHSITGQTPKIKLAICDRCEQKEKKHSWLKDKLANLPRPFSIKPSEHTPCEICQNYREEEEPPLRIIPLFQVSIRYD
jgi:hypothetical protein